MDAAGWHSSRRAAQQQQHTTTTSTSTAGSQQAADSTAGRALTHRGEQDARAAGHGQAAVEDLGMHVPVELLGGAAQLEGVEAVVCGQAEGKGWGQAGA